MCVREVLVIAGIYIEPKTSNAVYSPSWTTAVLMRNMASFIQSSFEFLWYSSIPICSYSLRIGAGYRSITAIFQIFSIGASRILITASSMLLRISFAMYPVPWSTGRTSGDT